MIRTRHDARARAGFTLVELMVSAAVCVIIMTVLSTAFSIALDAMRQLRSQGEMTDQLRAAEVVMKRDLRAAHHTGDEGVQNSGLRVSDYRFDLPAPPPGPRGGYFFISSPGSILEGSDGSLDSFRSNGGANYLLFTSVLPAGNNDQEYMTSIGGALVRSKAAEIGYFLAQQPGVTANGTIQLFNLHRRQRLVPTNDDERNRFQQYVVNEGFPYADTPQVLSTNRTLPLGTPPPVNLMSDLARTPAANYRVTPATLAGNRFGDDVLLSNVISFEVKVVWVARTGTNPPRPFGSSLAIRGTVDTPYTPASNAVSTDAPYDSLGAVGTPLGTFDTTASPAQRVLALQIRVRVYDPKLKNSRQMTIVQDL